MSFHNSNYRQPVILDDEMRMANEALDNNVISVTDSDKKEQEDEDDIWNIDTSLPTVDLDDVTVNIHSEELE